MTVVVQHGGAAMDLDTFIHLVNNVITYNNNNYFLLLFDPW